MSLVGPLAGAAGVPVCALNLIPVWTLDGGQAMVAVNRAGRIGIGIAAVLFAASRSQPLLLLVAGGAVYRAFDKMLARDMAPSYGVTAYFVTLLAGLGYLASACQKGGLYA